MAFAGVKFSSSKAINGTPKKSAAAQVSSMVQSALLRSLDAIDCGESPIALARSFFIKPLLDKIMFVFIATTSCLRNVALG